MKSIQRCFILIGVASLAALHSGILYAEAKAETRTVLTVYSAANPDEVQKWVDRFETYNPDIELNFIRGSTGTLAAKILAEKDNPRADVIWRLASTSLIAFSEMGMLQPYKPVGYDRIDVRFRDRADPPAWVGHMAYESVICYNLTEAAKRHLPLPKTWMDLTNPVYKGQIVMANPGSSGVGFLDVSAWLQIFGNDAGWQFMSALHKNIKFYVHSGTKPCALAAAGEVVAGLSAGYHAAAMKRKGAPIDIIRPSEGLGWDLEGSAIMKSTRHLAAARKFMDWVISDNAMKLYNEAHPIIGIPALARPVEFFPPDIMSRLIQNDFPWAAKNRAAILKEWERRYDSEAEQE
jgi:iron(III) transport system substrate-binding protein